MYLFACVITLKVFGIYSHAFIAISTNLCSVGDQLFRGGYNTLSIFPSAIRPLAQQCFYGRSEGEITKLGGKTTHDLFTNTMNIFRAQAVDPQNLNFTSLMSPDSEKLDVSTQTPFFSSKLLHESFIKPRNENPDLSYDYLSAELHSPSIQEIGRAHV